METQQGNPANAAKILAEEEDDKSEAGTEICSDLQRSCSCCQTEMTGGGSCCAAIVEKLMDQLKANDEEHKKREQVKRNKKWKI